MSNKQVALANAGPTHHDVQIVRHDGHIMLPNSLSLASAIDLLQKRLEFMTKVSNFDEIIDAFPWDGAIGFSAVLEETFGWVPPPSSTHTVETGPNPKDIRRVAWGSFEIPGLKAAVNCSAGVKDGTLVFRLVGKVINEHKDQLFRLIDATREYCREHSIYRGRAVAAQFLDDDGSVLAIPVLKFLDLSSIKEENAAYPKATADALETNLFTPVRRVRELEANGIQIKRGVLLSGPFGTGKSLAASLAAKLACAEGMTYVYVRDTRELPHALQFIRRYDDPAGMVFAEDIDRTTNRHSGRSISVDEVLNIMDGIESKSRRVMVVLTTNELAAIEPAMLRPGRLDSVIHVGPPDANAAAKLVQIYGGDALASDIDLKACGEKLSGMIPAAISEVMKRAKLSQLKLTPKGQLVGNITTEAILDAVNSIENQLMLLQVDDNSKKPTAALLLHALGNFMNGALPEEAYADSRDERIPLPRPTAKKVA